MFTAASTLDQHAVGQLEQQQDRGPAGARAARLDRRGLRTSAETTSASNSQREVSMSCTQVSTRTPSVVHAGRHRRVAVPGVVQQRGADLPVVQRGLHRAVGVVVAAHEPDHDQPLARGDLGVEDALARLPGGGERLLAEHLLARLDAGQHVLLVGGAPRGDDDRVDLGVRDQLLAGLQRLRGGQPGGHRLRPVDVHVRHRGDPRARQHVREPADVVLADHSDADDADVECHREQSFLDRCQYGQRRVGPTPQAAK